MFKYLCSVCKAKMEKPKVEAVKGVMLRGLGHFACRKHGRVPAVRVKASEAKSE